MVYYALIGDPVDRSPSPELHNAGFKEHGIDAVYLAMHVSADHLRDACEGLRALKFGGFNVTIPHKETVRELLDEENEPARSIGAVNTVTIRDGRLIGDNTDAAGLMDALTAAGMSAARGTRCVILGAGGAARAARWALRDVGADVTVVARTPGRLDGALGVETEAAAEAIAGAEVLLSAVPPNADPPPSAPAKGTFAMDLVYGPDGSTPFVEWAHRHGLVASDGTAMLHAQAARSFQIWTGRNLTISRR